MNNTIRCFYYSCRYLCVGIILSLSSIEAIAQERDSAMMKWLNEVVIEARRELYKSSSDVLTYNVAADTSLIGKNSYEALRNTPLVLAERNGSVRSVGGWPIEYLVNGARDHSILGDIRDALESLDAKYIKRIEVRIERQTDGQEKLQVNFITKGRLLGYRGNASSTLSDCDWKNGAYLFTKKKKLGVSFSYYNTWIWGHDAKQNTEEWRDGQNDFCHTIRRMKDSGYKTDLNNFETSISYDISPLTTFSIFASAMWKANPHSKVFSDCKVETPAGDPTYNYKHEKKYKVNTDAEYNVTVDYERLFGENAEKGKFYAGYEYYYRPVNTRTDGVYSSLEYQRSEYVKDFYNSEEHTNRYEKWHSLNVSFRRKINGKHLFYLEDLLRYRDESQSTSQKEFYKFAINPHLKERNETYNFWQLANALLWGYGLNYNKVIFNAGATHTFMRDHSEESLLQNSFFSNHHIFTPYADISYTLKGNARLRLSYGMGKSVPDINALNPYVHTDVPGQRTYGNPNLRPQTSHSLSLSSEFRVKKFFMRFSSTHTFAKNLILNHSFLQDNILHTTLDNLGKRYDNRAQASLSSKITRSTWMQMDVNLSYTNYAKTEHYKRNRGCTFFANAYIEQELPCGFDLSAGGGYNSPYIYMQGKGGENFYYNLNVYKSFVKQRLTIGLEANSFIPIRYSNSKENRSEGYYSITHYQSFHASFQLSLRWRFGKLKVEEHESENKFNHTDIKRNYDK